GHGATAPLLPCHSAFPKGPPQRGGQAEEKLVRLLTPTENKRLNELIGFLCIAVALMITAALFSYNPRDAAFNVSATSGSTHTAANWIGPAGGYGLDLLFQVFGFAEFVVPVGLCGRGLGGVRRRTC